MTMRYLTLGATALLLALGGCASQQPAGNGPTDATQQRLGSVESVSSLAFQQGQANKNALAELNRKLDTMAGKMAGEMADNAARLKQGQGIGEQAREQARESAAALGARLDKMERQLGELANQTAGVRSALPGIGEQASAATAPLAERLGKAEALLNQLSTQSDDVHNLLPALAGKASEADARLTAVDSRLNDLDARLAKLEKRLEEVAAMAMDALDATGLGQRRILGKVVYSITLTDDKTLFPINSPELGEKDMAQLDGLAARLKDMGTNYHLQIQGHTDGFGAEDYNYELGKARAEVVKNYLNEKWKIPLLRMSVISYGALAAPSYAGKSNRRIVVQILQ